MHGLVSHILKSNIWCYYVLMKYLVSWDSWLHNEIYWFSVSAAAGIESYSAKFTGDFKQYGTSTVSSTRTVVLYGSVVCSEKISAARKVVLTQWS